MPLLHAFGTAPGTRKAKTAAAAEDAVKTAWWKCDEGSGTTLADSAGSNDLTLANGSWTADTGRGTKPTWNGTTTQALCSTTSGTDCYTKKAITITAWIYPKTNGEGEQGHVVCNFMANGAVPNAGYFFMIQGTFPATSQIYAYVDADSVVAWSETGGYINYNEWCHIAMAYSDTDDRKIKCYYNGEETSYFVQRAAEGNLLDESTNSVALGNRVETTNKTFDGYIDDVRIYQQKLTAAQILEIYNEG